jgi:hypothetical protein
MPDLFLWGALDNDPQSVRLDPEGRKQIKREDLDRAKHIPDVNKPKVDTFDRFKRRTEEAQESLKRTIEAPLKKSDWV